MLYFAVQYPPLQPVIKKADSKDDKYGKYGDHHDKGKYAFYIHTISAVYTVVCQSFSPVAIFLNIFCNHYPFKPDYCYMPDERQIVQRIIDGDFRPFAMRVSEYEKLVFPVVNRLVQGSQDREDICQEVFLKVHKQ